MPAAAYAISVVATGVLALAACGESGAPVSQGPAGAETPALSPSPETTSLTSATSVRVLDLVGVALDYETQVPMAGVFVHGHHAYVGGMRTDYA